MQHARSNTDNIVVGLIVEAATEQRPADQAPGRQPVLAPELGVGRDCLDAGRPGTFIRDDLGRKFFGVSQQREQLRVVAGASSPAGPSTNAAGLGIFRYRTRCGTVYGHTGNFPGYTRWAAATASGKRSATTTLNVPAPTGRLLKRLRSVQTSAVCALLGK